MLKKILAASTASVLALTALAATAMADDATASGDDYVLELVPGTYSTWSEGSTTAHIAATVKTSEIASLIQKSMNVKINGTSTYPVTNGTIATQVPSIVNFTPGASIVMGTPATPEAGKYYYLDEDGTLTNTIRGAADTINVTGGITSGYKLILIKKLPVDGTGADAPVANKIDGCTYETVQSFVGFGSIENSGNPYHKLAMGLSLRDVLANDGTTVLKPYTWSDLEITNITMNSTLIGEGSDTVTVNGGTDVKSNVKRTAEGECKIPNIKGGSSPTNLVAPTNTAGFMTTQPVPMYNNFDIAAGKTLETLKPSDSEIRVEFDIKMKNSNWESLLGAAGVQWDNPATTNNSWTAIDFDKLLNGNDKVLKKFIGIEGTSVVDWATTATKGDLQVGTFGEDAINEVVASDIVVGDGSSTEHSNYFDSGVYQATNGDLITSTNVPVYVGLGTTKNNILKNLNNGGTVTFTFDKDIRNQDIFNPYIIWKGASGLVNLPLSLSNTYSGSSKELTLSFPAGLTWADSNTNFYNSFVMQFNLNYENSFAIQDGSQGLPLLEQGTNVQGTAQRNSFFKTGKDVVGADNYGAHLVKITFKANKDSSNQGGLVNNDPSSTSTPSSSNNSGTQSGEKNPGTGVAVAVAPVVLAAAGAAVVISKKRK